jgi:hypothetical protein
LKDFFNFLASCKIAMNAAAPEGAPPRRTRDKPAAHTGMIKIETDNDIYPVSPNQCRKGAMQLSNVLTGN